eukprot:COSAG02_NODE_163_length_32424_cov_21.759010_23_plen_144_part_00
MADLDNHIIDSSDDETDDDDDSGSSPTDQGTQSVAADTTSHSSTAPQGEKRKRSASLDADGQASSARPAPSAEQASDNGSAGNATARMHVPNVEQLRRGKMLVEQEERARALRYAGTAASEPSSPHLHYRVSSDSEGIDLQGF